jgi:hypothetical protein
LNGRRGTVLEATDLGLGAFLRPRGTATATALEITNSQTTSEEKRMNARKRTFAGMLVTSFVLAVPGAMEAQLAPPAGPADAGSARFSLNDVWSRLSTGAPGALRTGAFAEPAAGPTTATAKTTNELMAVAPVADNTNGATAADVALGKTFWGLRTTGGTWGLTTGTAPGGGSAYPAPVAKTAQTQCYRFDGANWVLDAGCATNTPANQDGKVQKGATTLPNPRFTKNGNGTVTDNLTGLIWLENANCFGGQTWVNAMNSANALASGACGLTDGSTAGQWRLPNRNELLSLTNIAYFGPAISNTAGTGQWTTGDPFTSPQNYYWSSSSGASNPAYAWLVGVSYGDVYYNGVRSTPYYVWPVRGG